MSAKGFACRAIGGHQSGWGSIDALMN